MRRGALLVSMWVLVLVAACQGEGPEQPAPPRGPTGASAASRLAPWPTYHRTPSRSGRTAQVAHPPLREAWTARLQGAVYGEPLVVGRLLVVATEQNWVYGLDPRTGRRTWAVHLGTPARLRDLPCGDIDPLGITSTPAYDPATGSVFVVAETTGARHTLWALDPTDGHRRWHRSLDVLPRRDRHAEQQRSALLVTHGRVLTAFGGLAGDCGNYVGYLTSAPVTGTGPVHHYAVPTAREAGMWSPAGPVVGPGGRVYVASGNGAELHGRWDLSDSVTALDPVRLGRQSVFAPGTWRDDNARDLDLGSSSPVPVGDRLVIAGKRGRVYLLRPDLGGVGAAVAVLDGCQAFGGAAVAGSTVLMPCKGEDAVRALRVGGHAMSWAWSASGIYGSPVVAGRYVYVADQGSGDLVVLRRRDGAVVQRVHAGALPHFPSQVVDGGWVFVPTLTGVSAFAGS